jgi:WD40 repeat protein
MFTSEFRTFRRVLLGLTYASGGRIVAATEGGWSLLDGATGLEITRYEHLEGCEKPWDIDGVRSRIVFTLVDRGGVRDVLPRGFAVYNLETGELLMKRFGVLDPGHFESAAAFGPNGKQLATGHVDGIVRVWDLDSGQLLLASDEPLSRVYAIAYSPDGQQLISGHENGLVVVWDSASLRKIHNFAGHSQRVWKFAISSNNARLASMSHDKTIRLWNLSDGSPDAVLRGHSLGVTDGAFAPDGKLLATVSSVPKLWSIPHAPDAHRIQTSGPVEGLAFDATGARVVTTSGYSVAVWDADNGQRLHGWDDVQGAVACALFNRDGSQLILGRQDGSLRFLDIPACETTRNVPKHIESVRAMALSRNGQHMASGSWDGQVVLSDGLGAERHRLVGHNQPVHSVAFSPDDSVVASASADGTVKVWKVATGECILTYSEHTRDVYGVAVSPDGGEVASASYDGTFRIWDAWTGATLRTVDGKMQDVWSIAYSPDGTRLVTGARDRTVRIWDAETGEQLLILRGPTGTVMRVAWSPDGRRIAAGSWNDELFIWDAPPARH